MGCPLHLLFPHVGLGGGETAMMALAEGLADDFDLTVGAFDNLPPEPGPTIRDELAARFGNVTLLRHRWQLRPFLAGARVVLWYGVVHQVPRALAALATRPRSIRVVHTDRAVDGVAFCRRWRSAIDAVVCVSPAVARRIPGALFIPNPCTPTGGDHGHLCGPARGFFPADPPRKTLGFLGRLTPLKNVRWLVENIAALDGNLLLQALDTSQLNVAALERLADRLGVRSRVRFLPPGRDVGSLLRSVDALVVVSRHEGFPMVVIEAGMLGVPVIATRVGALPELFTDEILFVDRRDGVPDLASLRGAIARLEPGRGELLRRAVSRLCDRRTVVSQYRELIGRLLRGTAAAPRTAQAGGSP